MLIRPKKKTLSRDDDYENSCKAELIYADTEADLEIDGMNLDFRQYYESFVFCSKEQLKEIKQNVDVVIFSGYAGSGHFAPSRALAKSYESNGKNVIIVDLLQMVWPFAALANCYSWLYVSRYNQNLFLKVSEKIGTEKGSDKALGILKSMNIDFLIDFILRKDVNVCISTYLSANAIASKIAKYVKMFGVLLPDACSIAMACEVYKHTENIVYFTLNEETIADAKSRYPYHNNTREFVVLGAVPSFMERNYELNIYSKTLTWIIGGGMGIGYGIESLESIIQMYKDPMVIVCGDNKSWYNKVSKAIKKYNASNVHVLGYCSPENIKVLMQNSKIIIGKPGGSTMSEFISMQGYKIFYGTIKGHEELNAEYCQSNEIVRWCKNIYELITELKNPVYTESIYSKNIIDKNPCDTIIEYTSKYF